MLLANRSSGCLQAPCRSSHRSSRSSSSSSSISSRRAPAAFSSRRHAAEPAAAAASSSSSSSQPQQQRRNASSVGGALAAAALAAWLSSASPAPALAADAVASPSSSSAAAVETPTVYFGNGCFWGRQKDFVETERARLGRVDAAAISALSGYAGGGLGAGPNGGVCYHFNDPRTVYERLGHAEVVQVALSAGDAAAQEREFREFARTYFADFKPLRNGGGKMLRLDPQDAGPGYRNVVGLPGGVRSPYFALLQEANVNRMELREGSGSVFDQQARRWTEDDEVNVVWVVDSTRLPFYRAEVYHQFHPDMGGTAGRGYTVDLKRAVAATGRIAPVPGCAELPF